MWGQSSIVTEEQDTTQVPASLTDSSEGPVSREALYEMVWSEPMLRVAARFGFAVRFPRGRWSGGFGRERARFGRAPSRVHSSGSPGRGSGSGGCFGALPTASFAQ